jgi:hypothetical protein
LLCLAVMQAGMPGGRVEYVGGTIAQFHDKIDGQLSTTDSQILIFSYDGKRFGVPYERINLLEYGQNVSRRLAEAIIISPLFLLSKSRKHFLTVGYRDDNDQQQAMVFRVSKKDVRALLVSLEARTGLRVQYQDDEARKAGKG